MMGDSDSDSDYNPSDYCIPHLRCGLCRFDLEQGDGIVACTFIIPRGKHTASADVMSDINGGRQRSYFSFHPHKRYEDPDLRKSFHACHPECIDGGLHVPVFHTGCLNFRTHPVSSRFLAATEHSHLPPTSEGRRRFELIRNLLPLNLSRVLPVKLPTEILIKIAELLVRECAVITSQRTDPGSCTPTSRVLRGRPYP